MKEPLARIATIALTFAIFHAGCEKSAPAPQAATSPSPTSTSAPAPPVADAATPTLATFRTGVREPKPRTAGALRLADYNVENLFDDKDDPALRDQEEDAGNAKPEADEKALADTIRRIDADVIAMQEVESFDALVSFRDRHLGGLGYDHVVSIEAGRERGIENSVLSRFPLKDPKVWRDAELGGVHPDLFNGRANMYAGQPLTMRGSPLRVTVEIPAGAAGGKPWPLTLFVVHHKSGRGNEYWREAEARKIIELVRELEAADPGRCIAVLGDFNALPEDESVQMYLRAGLADINADRSPGDEASLTHASARVIDMILVNRALAARVVRESRFILATPQRPADADYRTTDPPPGYASDHSPVVVDLRHAAP